jgi:hypothetical protein
MVRLESVISIPKSIIDLPSISKSIIDLPSIWLGKRSTFKMVRQGAVESVISVPCF